MDRYAFQFHYILTLLKESGNGFGISKIDDIIIMMSVYNPSSDFKLLSNFLANAYLKIDPLPQPVTVI